MVKRKTKKSVPKLHLTNKAALVALGLIFLLLLAFIAFCYCRILWTKTRTIEDWQLKTMILEASDAINQPAIVDGPTRKVYLPEAKLVLPPPPSDIAGIKYSRFFEENAADTELQVTTDRAIGYGRLQLYRNANNEEMFKKVPILQACTRQFIFKMNTGELPTFDDYSEVFSKTLADGRVLRAYKSNKCPENAESFQAYLNQVQSY